MAETVKIRVKALVTAEGKWAAYGWWSADEADCDGVLFDMLCGDHMEIERAVYLVAEIKLPRAVEVAASIEDVAPEAGGAGR